MFSDLPDPSAFLKFGPLGLAALVLVLVAMSLTLKLDRERTGLIRNILYVGTFLFVVASGFAFASLHYGTSETKTADLYKARDASQMRAL